MKFHNLEKKKVPELRITKHKTYEQATNRTVVKQVEQRDEESPTVLSIASHHGVEVRTLCPARLVLSEAPDHRVLGAHNGLLYLI